MKYEERAPEKYRPSPGTMYPWKQRKVRYNMLLASL